MSEKGPVTIDYDRLAYPTGSSWQALPVDAPSGPSKLRQLVLAQKALIDTYNEARVVPRSAGHNSIWVPRFRTVGTAIADLAQSLPLIQPDPKEPLSWYRFKRGELLSSLSAAEAKTVPLDALFSGEVTAKELPDPLVDWTSAGWTETDPNGHISVAANTITVTGLNMGEDASYWRDYGAGHFGNLTHNVTASAHYTTGASYPQIVFWAVSNYQEDAQYWYDNFSAALLLQAYVYASAYMMLLDCVSHHLDQSIALLENTLYDCIISKSGTAVQALIYLGGILKDTVTITADSDLTYRWLYSVNTFNVGNSSKHVEAVVKNLDLNEAAAGHVPYTLLLARSAA